MAVSREKRAQKAIKKEIDRQASLKEKMEIQQKKEEFGESWKYNLSAAQKKEMESVVGDLNAPILYDSIDINNFFDPITMYKKKRGEKIFLDIDKYKEAEAAYEDALKDIDADLYGREKEEDKSLEDTIKDSLNQDEKNSIQEVIKIPKFLQEKYAKWGKYFGRYFPVYNKYVCSCCGRPLPISEFFLDYNEVNLGRIESNGKMHAHICKDCCKKLYEYLYFERAKKDPEETMKLYCSYINIYYDSKLYYQAKHNMEEHSGKNHIITEYMALINKDSVLKSRTFIDSKLNFNNSSKIADNNDAICDDGEFAGWTKEELKDRKIVVKMVGYDPFDYELPETRKNLYKDLLGMLEQGMEMDQVKLQAAIQIVTSFARVREMNKLYRQKQQENASITELKALSDLKTKEMNTITQFAKDNGFAERYATAKAKGENTFTGIMNKMNEAKYEDALVNKYDIETSETIQQAANASFKAIMHQLSLGEAEVWKVCQDQLRELEKLRRENSGLQEELRKTKYELAKIDLEEQAEQQGLNKDDDDGLFGGDY